MNCNDPKGVLASTSASRESSPRVSSAATIIEHKHCIQVVIVEIIVHPNPEPRNRNERRTTEVLALRSVVLGSENKQFVHKKVNPRPVLVKKDICMYAIVDLEFGIVPRTCRHCHFGAAKKETPVQTHKC